MQEKDSIIHKYEWSIVFFDRLYIKTKYIILK